MGLKRIGIEKTHAINKYVEPTLGRDGRVKQTQRSGGGISGVGEWRFTFRLPLGVNAFKLLFRHINLTAQFYAVEGLRINLQRN